MGNNVKVVKTTHKGVMPRDQADEKKCDDELVGSNDGSSDTGQSSDDKSSFDVNEDNDSIDDGNSSVHSTGEDKDTIEDDSVSDYAADEDNDSSDDGSSITEDVTDAKTEKEKSRGIAKVSAQKITKAPRQAKA